MFTLAPGEHQPAHQEEGGSEQVSRGEECGARPPGPRRQHPRPALPRHGQAQHRRQAWGNILQKILIFQLFYAQIDFSI